MSAMWVATALQRAALRTPRRPWAPLYSLAAWAYARWLLRGAGEASAYVRGSLASGRPVPGLSDLDLVVVAADDRDVRAVERRHARLAERWPTLAEVALEPPRLHREDELRAIGGASILTFGAAAYARGPLSGTVRALERPGLDPLGADWRLVRGRERRPPRPALDAQQRRVRVWLEVQYRWRWAWRALGGELPPVRAADVMAKLVLETARGLAAIGGPRRDPTYAEAVARRPDRPADLDRLLAEALDATAAVAEAIEREVGGDVEAVALAGVAAARAAAERGPLATPPLPLADWRAVVRPWPDDDGLVPLGDAPTRDAFARAQRASRRGAYPVLRHGPLILLAPGKWFRGALRAVQCAATDPVSFALLAGEEVARFPRAAGWSVGDWARRAVAEHAAVRDPAVRAGAARARLLQESVDDGAPVLMVTRDAALAAA